MQIGTFRRQVMKTVATKGTKVALRTVSKNTIRVQLAHHAVTLKINTGILLQGMSQYLLGTPQTQEMKQGALWALGDIGYDLTVLARGLKMKLPASTKRLKLSGTRGAAILHLDSLATELLLRVEAGAFGLPKMTTVQKLVTLPLKGGVKEMRDKSIVDVEADAAAEAERQTQMRTYLASAVDVYWRLCYDLFGYPPAGVFDEKFTRMRSQFPGVPWATDTPKKGKVKAPTAKKVTAA